MSLTRTAPPSEINIKVSPTENLITERLTGFNTDQARAVVWQALEAHEFNDHDWDEICTAMAWLE